MDDVYSLFQRCFPQFSVPWNIFWELLSFEKCRIYKKEKNDVCIGISVWEGNKIRLLMVDPEFRRQGIGQELLQYSEAKMKEAGYDKVILGGNDSKLFLGAIISKEEWERKISNYFAKRGYAAENRCLEMQLKLDNFIYPKDSLLYPEKIRFEYYTGEKDKLWKAVAKVDKEWVQYFKQDYSIYVAMEEDEIAAFCILIFEDKALLCSVDTKVGSIGCVGTVSKKRNRGIGLSMVGMATLELQKHGCDISWIHYTYLDWWYKKLGYETYLRFWLGHKRLR